jgi:hypothetical protein
VNWTIVVTSAITAVVGIAGVAGGVITNRSAVESARKSAKRSITAEADRTRLADKRRIYARALGALNSAALARRYLAETGRPDFRDKEDEYEANASATLRAAEEAVAELQLIADKLATAELAKEALDSVSDPAADYPDHRDKLLTALRADLEKEADRAYK